MGSTRRLALVAIVVVFAASEARAQEFVWARQFGGSSFDGGTSITVDSDGNAYTTGFFDDTADFDPGPGVYNLTSAGNDDIFVSKLDPNGNFIWARHMGGPGIDGGLSIAVDSAGNVYTTGKFSSTADFDPGPGVYNLASAGSDDIFVSKLDPNGDFIWAKRMGGSDSDNGRSIVVDSAGNAYTTGEFRGTADFDPGPGVYNLTSAGLQEISVSKLDSNGNFVWAKRMGGPGVDYPLSITVDSAGNAYTTGYFDGTADFDPGPGDYNLTSAGNEDIFVAKLDPNGNFIWAKRMGGSFTDTGRSIAVDSTDNVYTTGSFSDTVDFDPGPGVYDLTSAGGPDIFFSTLDSNGNFVWAKRMGGISSNFGHSIAVDSAGNIYTTGSFDGTADFDPGPGDYNLTSAGAHDIFASKLDPNGNFIWAKRMGGSSSDRGRSIAVDRAANAYTTGEFDGTADFGSYILTSTGVRDVFVSKLPDCDSLTKESNYGSLLFARLCTRDASELPGSAGEPYVYDSSGLGLYRGASDRFYLSSNGNAFSSLVVDDAVRINGQPSGLGPHEYQPGVPPFLIGVPIDRNLVPEPPHDVTALIPLGTSRALFEALDTQRQIYGNTSVFLVRDCGIWLGENGSGQTTINFVSHDVDVGGVQSNLSVVTGLVSELRSDHDFTRATCLGTFIDTTQATDTRPDPFDSVGYYYLVRGSCSDPTYGDSNGLSPDPRDALNASDPCP